MQVPPSSTLFPYTTLFRSEVQDKGRQDQPHTHQQAGSVLPVLNAHEAHLPSSLKYGGRAGQDIPPACAVLPLLLRQDRKSTRLNSSHVSISYAVFCLKKKH